MADRRAAVPAPAAALGGPAAAPMGPAGPAASPFGPPAAGLGAQPAQPGALGRWVPCVMKSHKIQVDPTKANWSEFEMFEIPCF